MDVVIILGSKADLKLGEEIKNWLSFFNIDAKIKIASAHKTPEKVLQIISENKNAIFITVAGRSDALSGFVSANTENPVIACPPLSDKFAGLNILSSIDMPSGVSPMLVLYAENAALATAKIIALNNPEIKERVREYMKKKKDEVLMADKDEII